MIYFIYRLDIYLIIISQLATQEADLDTQGMILGMLQKKSRTGYELKKVFSMSFAFFSEISFGSIYPALKKMEQDGLITMDMEIQHSAPNRKIYTITDKGRERFKTILTSPIDLVSFRSDFLSRLFFFSQLSRDDRKIICDAYLFEISEKMAQMETRRPAIEKKADPFQLQCFEFGLRFFQDLAANVTERVTALEDQP